MRQAIYITKTAVKLKWYQFEAAVERIAEGASVIAIPTYLVVYRAAACGVRAMAPRHRAGCLCTTDAARADQPPEWLCRLRPTQLDSSVGRLAANRSRNRTL